MFEFLGEFFGELFSGALEGLFESFLSGDFKKKKQPQTDSGEPLAPS